MDRKGLSYSAAGIDIDDTDAAKQRMARSVDAGDSRVLNRLGAFASLVEGRFAEVEDPILVLKTEEPGSKQQLAFQLDRVESLCQDLIHHLINDIAVTGAFPQYVLDCIVCGQFDAPVIDRLVAGMAAACQAQGALLVGGETSVQPGVVPVGQYILSATVVGVVDRRRAIDGTAIKPGDAVMAVSSNGLHTNGYTLVRQLLAERPEVSSLTVDGQAFIDVIMRPHTGYFLALRDVLGDTDVHGLAHITGGGIRDNVRRILPASVDARIDLGRLRVPTVFRVIREYGGVIDSDMLRTFNLGCGLVAICSRDAISKLTGHFGAQGLDCWVIGEVTEGTGSVVASGDVPWAG